MTDIVNVPAIPALPTPPSTNDPNHFAARADAFLGILPEWSGDLDGVAQTAKTNATAANERAIAAAASASTASTKATEAAASAELAKNAPSTYGTTAQVITISAESKSLIVETGRAFVSGQAVVLASTANPASQRMYGIVTAYNATSGALSVSVSSFTGSGSAAGWTVTLGNEPSNGDLEVINFSVTAAAVMGRMNVLTAAGVELWMPPVPVLNSVVGFCNASSGSVLVYWNGASVKGVKPDPDGMFVPQFGSAIVRWNGGTWV